ncbi:MAG: DUF1127 domain-containing protein [Pikeienuella sp.]
MSLFEQQRPAPFGAESVYKVTSTIENVFLTITNMIKAKLVADRTYRTLSQLSAHQLNDIGLGQTDLREYAKSASRRLF